MKIDSVCLNLFDTNSFFVNTGKGYFIVDPSSSEQSLLDMIEEPLDAILLTHEHIDHIIGIGNIYKNLKRVPIYCSSETKKIITNKEILKQRVDSISYNLSDYFKQEILDLKDLEIIELKDGDDFFGFTVLETPGHSEGCISLYNEEEKVLFSGDTIFKSGYGRYDLEGGNYDKLKSSIQRLLELDPNTIIYPGHGDISTIEEERQTLSFL